MEIDYRPWGIFKVLHEAPNFKVKELIVQPNKALSLQSHDRREEHWIGVEGNGWAYIGYRKQRVCAGSHHYIPISAIHRLINDTDEVLIIIEVQTGDYFGEDDITRYEDRYGRI